MKFDFSHALGVTPSQIRVHIDKLAPYINKLSAVAASGIYNEPESLIRAAIDPEILNQVYAVTKKVGIGNIKYIFVIGIGGSSLGSQAVYSAVASTVIDRHETIPEVIYLDTIDTSALLRAIKIIEEKAVSPDEIAVCLISKSGNTLESIVNFNVLENRLKVRWGNSIRGRIIIVTSKQSVLWEEAQRDNYFTLSIPDEVPGRFSVFTAAGLLPLVLARIHVEDLLKGASEMLSYSLEHADYAPFQSAAILYEYYRHDIRINDNFFFAPSLENVGKWYRQLASESLGKSRDKNGALIRSGITTTVSVGTNDLHSIAQLQLGGPRDKIVSFVAVSSAGPEIIIHGNDVASTISHAISGKKLSEIYSALFQGAVTAYTEGEIPFTETILEKVSERCLGEYMMFKMLEVMALGFLMGINTFDQPAIESYKNEAFKILNIPK